MNGHTRYCSIYSVLVVCVGLHEHEQSIKICRITRMDYAVRRVVTTMESLNEGTT
jgi:hypothetical protein